MRITVDTKALDKAILRASKATTDITISIEAFIEATKRLKINTKAIKEQSGPDIYAQEFKRLSEL